MSQLEKAAELCLVWHQGQVDKGGREYFLHPFSIMMECETEEQKIVALLHDILEDTDCPTAELSHFSDEIVEAIYTITRKEEEKYFDYIERVKENELARYVKIKDLKQNLSKTSSLPDSLKKRYEKALDMLIDTVDPDWEALMYYW